MIPGIDIEEVWSYRPNASDLYNIERSVNPDGGGGARYIQIRKSQLPAMLAFLGLSSVPTGPLSISVRSHFDPSRLDVVEFDVKSQERMRIANQNRHWRKRVSGWSPEAGFPSLGPSDTTEDAQRLIAKLGGIHIYLVRDVDGQVWAGFTTGATPPADWGPIPFSDMLFGSSDGGYWRYTGDGK